MLVFRQIDDPALSLQASVVTIGNFDGIHLGHQTLVAQTVEAAQRRKAASVVVTFDPHPLKVLAPERAPRLILTAEDKIEILGALGVDVVVRQRFDRAFANLRAEEFVRRLVLGRLKTMKMFVGRDLRFGRAREGNVEQLLRWGETLGFDVSIVEPVLVDGVRVSSSRIRGLVEHGRVEEARASLGRYHFISGTVIQGNRRGRQIGYPTANIASRTEVIPGDGIYATLFHVDGKWWPSASSIGSNPTFGAGPRTIESFILDFDEAIYEKPIKLAFVKRIREEKKFIDVPALVAQIQDDVEVTRAVFDEIGYEDKKGAAR
ncbi:MAG TPA: bifunctional riboflavin kinase/FAD synthetase [Candidatus Binatia bacterium]|nr:bifunctional riboflavin kinase/FAD synthetase [Candidatus Binatia bacterium]